MGVLNAAASAAALPATSCDFTSDRLTPSLREITDAIPAPTCTDGPSRPSETPLASAVQQQMNFPITVRMVMLPSSTNSAYLAWGMPLPRAKGK